MAAFASGPAFRAGRREPGEVTPGGPPCQHLFSTFFRTAVAARPCPGFPFAEERFYAFPRGPSTLFFNLDPIRFRVSSRARFPEAEGSFTQPFPARQHFFSISRRTVVLRAAIPVSRHAEECLYAPLTGPSTLFFQFVTGPSSRPGPHPASRCVEGCFYAPQAGASTPFSQHRHFSGARREDNPPRRPRRGHIGGRREGKSALPGQGILPAPSLRRPAPPARDRALPRRRHRASGWGSPQP